MPGVARDGQVQDVVLAAGEADGGGDGVLAAGEGDVGDQEADEALAFARRGGRVVPEGGEVGRQGVDAGALGGIERDGRGLGGGVVVVSGGQVAQRGVPVGFEGVGDEPVAGVDGQVAAAGLVGGVWARWTCAARRESACSALRMSSSLTVRAASSASGVRVSSSKLATAASMGAPDRCWQIGWASRMPSFWHT